MTVRTEKRGRVWTVIHGRPESRSAMDPQSAEPLADGKGRRGDIGSF